MSACMHAMTGKNMKRLSLLLIILVSVQEIESRNITLNSIKFRRSILAQFNQARRIFASGDLEKLLNLISWAGNLDEFRRNGFVGPGADMYKMVWNRELEQTAYDYVEESGKNVLETFGKTLHRNGHLGFHWVGTIFDILKLLDLPKLHEMMDTIKDIIETVIITLWMFLAIPWHTPMNDGHFGAGEALFSKRYEIGCYSGIVLSVCFVKRIPYQENVFQKGAACSQCPTHCELLPTQDDDYLEGELCVPPNDYYRRQMKEIEYKEKGEEKLEKRATCSLSATLFVLILVFYGSGVSSNFYI